MVQAEAAGSGPAQHRGPRPGQGPRQRASKASEGVPSSSFKQQHSRLERESRADRRAFLSPKSLGPRPGALVPTYTCPPACPRLARSPGLCCTHSREAWQPRRAPVVGTGERHQEGQAAGDTVQLVTFPHSQVPAGSSWRGRSAAPAPTDTETCKSSGEPAADRPSPRGAGDPGRAGPAVSVGQVWTCLRRSDPCPSATSSVLVAQPPLLATAPREDMSLWPGWGGCPAREGSRDRRGKPGAPGHPQTCHGSSGVPPEGCGELAPATAERGRPAVNSWLLKPFPGLDVRGVHEPGLVRVAGDLAE